jgi:hypothetical protein
VTTLDLRDLIGKPQRLLSGYSLVVAACTVGANLTLGLSVALLDVAFGALVLVIFLFWSSLQRLTGETDLSLEEALSMAAPSAEEEQKRSVLRALKDLEFEKSVGKISDEDYRMLSEGYRRQAKELMRALDASVEPMRAEIDALVAARLGEAPLPVEKKKKNRKRAAKPASTSAEAAGAASAEEAREVSAEGVPVPSEHPLCAACAAPNDTDARFCKRCGAALEVSHEAS